MATPHDSLFRDTFGKTEHAAPLLRALLPAELVAAIDWTSLEPHPVPQIDPGTGRLRPDGAGKFLALVGERRARNGEEEGQDGPPQHRAFP